MKVPHITITVFRPILIALLLLSASFSTLLAQTDDDETGPNGEGRVEHAAEAAAWHADFINPLHDTNMLVKRQNGLAEFRQMTGTPAMKAASTTSWILVGKSQGINQIGQVSGRGTCLSIGTNGDMYYGVTQGGLWKSTDRGANWVSLSSDWATLAVGGVAVDPKNPLVVYAGTGEAMAALGDTGNTYSVIGPSEGVGVLKSVDGGKNWTVAYPKQGLVTNQMLINPANSNLVYLASTKGVVLGSDSSGVMVWKNVCALNGTTSIVIDPLDPSVIYAAGANSIHKSNDSGKTFRALTISGKAVTMTLAISPANHLKLYVSIDQSNGSRIDSSGDSGHTWHQAFLAKRYAPVDWLTTQGYYANAIAVSPTDANQIVVGGLNVYHSTDGGTTWTDSTNSNSTSSSSRYCHADVHKLVYFGDTLFALSDGGLYHSETFGSRWAHDLNHNLGTFEFVGGDMYPDASGDPSYFVAGAQDNGLNKIQSNQSVWTSIHGGDGGRMFIGQDDGQTVYGTYIEANLYESTDGGSTWLNNGYNMLQGTALGNERAPFYMEFDVSSTSGQNVALVGNKNVYLTTDGFSSDALPVAGPSSSNHIGGVPQCVQFATSDANYMFLGTRNRLVYYSQDQGNTWKKSNDTLGIPSCFATDPTDPSLVYVTTKSLGGGFGGKFYFSTNGGQDWTAPANNNLTTSLNYYAVAASADKIFVGNDYGVLVSTDKGAHWASTAALGFPQCQVMSLRIRSHYLVATTYGRGMYYIDINGVSGASGVTQNANTSSTGNAIAAVYPNPVPSSHAQSTISFSVAEDSRATIGVYDVLGREERVLVNEWATKGQHETIADLSGLASGQHYIVLNTGGSSVTQPVTIQ